MAPRLPLEISSALADRASALRARSTGRVMDLDDMEITEAEGSYDTILCFVKALYEADLDGFFERLRRHLAVDGTLYVLEPTVRTGTLGRALSLGGRLARPVTGLHLDRDIVQAVRRAGLFVTDLHRFEIASVAAPLRPFVEGWARFPTPPPALDGKLS